MKYLSLAWYSGCVNCYVGSFVQTTLEQFRCTLESLWFSNSDGFKQVFVGKCSFLAVFLSLTQFQTCNTELLRPLRNPKRTHSNQMLCSRFTFSGKEFQHKEPNEIRYRGFQNWYQYYIEERRPHNVIQKIQGLPTFVMNKRVSFPAVYSLLYD